MSDIEAGIKELADRVREHGHTITTEEAAKTSIVLPFLKLLGYDVFNPSEVIPEFTADAAGKKGEKVDYAIRIDGKISTLIECKGLTTSLEQKQLSQLYRYFSVTEAKFAILTNGRFFEFYSDLDAPNKLDQRPFFILDLLDYNSRTIGELSKFSRSAFDADRILKNAERLRYVSGVKKYLKAQMEDPSEDFVKLLASELHDGRVTKSVREIVSEATKVAFTELVREAVQSRLSSALDESESAIEETAEDDTTQDSEIETTQQEIEGMLTIRAIVCDILEASRVDLRDARSYCAIIVDDNNRKTLARLHFNRKKWYLGVFDTGKEERLHIEAVSDIYKHSDRIRKTAELFVEQ